MELEVMGLCHTDGFAKTLYVQLRPTPELEHMVALLVAASNGAARAHLDPHVSLLYHSLDSATKQSLIDRIALPRPTLRFNQVHAIAAPQNFATQAHVSQLRPVHSRFLTTP